MALIAPITSRQGIDTGSAPSTARDNSIAQGLGQLGSAIGGLGEQFAQQKQRLAAQQMQAEAFAIEQSWQRLNHQLNAGYEEAKGVIDPSGVGFTDAVDKANNGAYEDFLKTVPDHLKHQYLEVVRTDKDRRVLIASGDEVAQRQSWYVGGVTDYIDGAAREVINDPGLFHVKLDESRRVIATTGLAPKAKESALRMAEHNLGMAVKGHFLEADPEALKGMTGILDPANADTTKVIQGFEGFRAAAYWDVNAHRVGYGSDTITKADGTVVKVTEGMTVTREDADRDLKRRIGEFQQGIVSDIGQGAWDGLPAQAKAALTSVAYNYGRLPTTVREAAKRGDINAIARAVEGLSGHNGGINADRRRKEAAMIRGASGIPDERLAGLSTDELIEAYDQATAASRARATAAAAQATADIAAVGDLMERGIRTGEVTSRETILSNPVLANDPGRQASLINMLDAELGQRTKAQEFAALLAAGTAPAINPYNADQRRIADDAYELMIEAVPEDQRAAFGAQFIAETKVVPASVVATIRQGMAGTTTDTVAAALQQAAWTKDAAGDALLTVEHGKEIAEAAATYDELVNARGLSVTEAAAELLRQRDPAARMQASVLDDLWDKAVRDGAFGVDDVRHAFDTTWFFGEPSAGVTPAQEAALLADYHDAAERAFKGPANGDAGVARTMAVDEMRRTYGVSAVSGSDVIMKFPPEKFYEPVNGSHSYIRDEALADARSIAPEAGNVMLLSSPQTASDIRAGQPPRYNLFYQRQDGAWDMAPDLWVLDPEKATQVRQQAFDEARARAMAPPAADNPEQAAFVRSMLVGGSPPASMQVEPAVTPAQAIPPRPVPIVPPSPVQSNAQQTLDGLNATRDAITGGSLPSISSPIR